MLDIFLEFWAVLWPEWLPSLSQEFLGRPQASILQVVSEADTFQHLCGALFMNCTARPMITWLGLPKNR